MLSKKEFCEILNQLKAETEKEDKFNEALTLFDEDHIGFFCFHPLEKTLNICLSLLGKQFPNNPDEASDAIDYFVWELDWGKESSYDYDIEDDKGVKWSLKTSEILYDYITRE